MRMMKPALLAMVLALGAGAARGDTVPPSKGNDTGGIISTSLIGVADIDGMAIAHCAQYGKVPKRLGAPQQYGMYLSFACQWVPVGSYRRPLHVRY